jgi:hypothetical protein
MPTKVYTSIVAALGFVLCDLQKQPDKSTQRRYESAQCTYTSPLWHLVDTFAISSMLRGKDGVLVLASGIHLMFLRQPIRHAFEITGCDIMM